MPRLFPGSRVRHNYADGHGIGSVIEVAEKFEERFAYKVLWDSGVGPEPYTYNDETQEIVPVRDNYIVMRKVEEDKLYMSDLGFTMAREDGKTPNGNPIGQRWVLRDPKGHWLDVSQYRNDLASWWHLDLGH
jgi:hypothetical protein